jgi:hypothetical protein
VHGDGRVDQVAAERTQPRQDAILVRAGRDACSRLRPSTESPRFCVFPAWGLRRTQTSTNRTNAVATGLDLAQSEWPPKHGENLNGLNAEISRILGKLGDAS